jgi:hypothetical protein
MCDSCIWLCSSFFQLFLTEIMNLFDFYWPGWIIFIDPRRVETLRSRQVVDLGKTVTPRRYSNIIEIKIDWYKMNFVS